MPRRKKVKPTKRDWRWYANFGLNGLLVISMGVGTILLFTGNPLQQRSSVEFPTDIPGIDIPTLAPTVGAPLTAVVPLNPTPAQTPAATPTVKP